MTPNYSASWDFLAAFHPGRPVVVTGVSLDKTSLPTETFGPGDREKFLKWIEACGKSNCNLYFSVGEPMEAVRKKMDRQDIKAVHYLHVDVDPVAGKDIKAEQDRILAMFRTPPTSIPPPSIIVYSGGGYQGYWRLKAPIVIDGDQSKAEEAKLYNVQLERLFGGDHCHNVDRIMRIPGTINLPDAKKQKKGRVPALAAVIEQKGLTYDISAFIKAPASQQGSAGLSPKLRAPSNIKRLASANDLGERVKGSVKVYVAQGCNPDEPDHFQSRSEMLFWVVCELVRACVDDDVIYSVITDPDFKISASVLEKGNGADKYAMRQIERAHEEAIDPVLAELNERHAVIENLGGQCKVIEEVWDMAVQRSRLSSQSFSAIRDRYMHRKVQVGTKFDKASKQDIAQMMPAGQWWLQHEQRRQFRNIVFAPGAETPGSYNLWRGFAVDARPGDCSLILNHVRDNLCHGVKVDYEYMIGWLASVVQFPASPGNTAVVIIGKKGTGKTILGTIFGSLFGRHYISVTNKDHLVGNFNAHLRDVVFLLGDEAFFAGDKSSESNLKTIITEPMIMVTPKGVDSEFSMNCVHLMMASNERWVVPAGYDERRFFVLKSSDLRRNDTDYFGAILEQMDMLPNKKTSNGGREALLHYLLTYDLSKFNIRKIPETEGLREQKAMSMEPDAEWWLHLLRRGTALPEHAEWRTDVSVDQLAIDYLNYSRSTDVSRRSNSVRLGMSLKKFMPEGDLPRYQRHSPLDITWPGTGPISVPRPWFYKIPPLDECRAHFDREYGGPYKWAADLPAEEAPVYEDQHVLGSDIL